MMIDNTVKIKTLSALVTLVAAAKADRRAVVLSCGVFDVIHPGHIRHIEAARKEGDLLIIGVTADRHVQRGMGSPVFQQQLRAEVLAALQQVDYVVINDLPTDIELIRALQPTVYARGSDAGDGTPGEARGGGRSWMEVMQEVGGRVVYTHELTFHTSTITNGFFQVYPKETTDYLKNFCQRVNRDEMLANIERLTICKVLVIGDTIIDEYHYCSPMGKSPKENIIVTRHTSEERFAGGVLAATNHVAGFCSQVDMITCLGEENSHEEFVRSHLKRNVNPTLFFRKNAPTIVKRRFVESAFLRKLFEICFINGDRLTASEEAELRAYLDDIIEKYDLVLVTDFGHGLMTPELIELVSRKAKFLAVNAQSNSANTGYNFITKYPRADYICIDEPEARLALHDRTSSLETLIQRLSAQLDARFVTITRGNQGCTVYSREEGFARIPVLATSVIDTVGAGDAFLSVSAPCVAMGFPMEQAGFIGNATGALKVGIVGNRAAVEKHQLTGFVRTLLR